MKITLITISAAVVFTLLASYLSPLVSVSSAADYNATQAAEELCNGTAAGGGEKSPICDPKDVFTILAKAVRYAYTIFFILAVLFILFAAFSYLTAGGDAAKVKTATQSIMWAAVAIAVALISVGAAQLIKNFLITANP